MLLKGKFCIFALIYGIRKRYTVVPICSLQHRWWGLVLAETHPAQWVTLLICMTVNYILLPVGSTVVPQMQPWLLPVAVVCACVMVLSCVVIIIIAGIIIARRRQSSKYSVHWFSLMIVLSYDCVMSPFCLLLSSLFIHFCFYYPDFYLYDESSLLSFSEFPFPLPLPQWEAFTYLVHACYILHTKNTVNSPCILYKSRIHNFLEMDSIGDFIYSILAYCLT